MKPNKELLDKLYERFEMKVRAGRYYKHGIYWCHIRETAVRRPVIVKTTVNKKHGWKQHAK